MQYHFALLTMTQVARAFLNDATKAGNKNRRIGHVKSQSVTSHVPNAFAARNDRKTARPFASVRNNPSRANGALGLPYVYILSAPLCFDIRNLTMHRQARVSPVQPSSANLLLPGQLPPHILAAKEARERRSRVHQAEDGDKLTAKTVLPPPPALASQNRYAALSQDILTPEPTGSSVSSFTPPRESSMESEQKRSHTGSHLEPYEELLPEVPSKTSVEKETRKDSHVFSIGTLKSFDTPSAKDPLEEKTCALCQRSLLQPSSVQKDACSNCCSMIHTIDDARAVIENYDIDGPQGLLKGEETHPQPTYCAATMLTDRIDLPQHDEQPIAPGNETAKTFNQETPPHPPSVKTKSSLVPTAQSFFMSRNAQPNVAAVGSISDAKEQVQQTHRQNTINTESTYYGHSALLNDLHGWNHAADAYDGNLDPSQPGQAYHYSLLHPGESGLSDSHEVSEAMRSPCIEQHLPFADLVTPLEASLTNSPSIPIITPDRSETDSRLKLQSLSNTAATVSSTFSENDDTFDDCVNRFQGGTDGQEIPATKSPSFSMALSSESREDHPESGTWLAHNRAIEIEQVARRLPMQDRVVNGFQQENDDSLISFQSSEEIARPKGTRSRLHCVDRISTGSGEKVASGRPQLDTFDDAPEPEPELSGDQGEIISASHEPSKNKSSNKIAQKERRQMRKVLRDELLMAWCTRESARKRVAGGFTLERMKALQDATRAYHAKREGLQNASPEGVLNEDDELMFPTLRVADVSTPLRWPRGADEVFRAQRASAVQNEQRDKSPDHATTPVDEELNELKQQALKALQNLRNAEASVKYPAAQGRAKMKQLKEDARAKLKRARQWYVRKRKEVEDKNPDDPSLVGELPWVAEHV